MYLLAKNSVYSFGLKILTNFKLNLLQVLYHAQLSWVLGCLTMMPRLGQLPQFKEKSSSLKDIPLGLYIYPVLQAADILLYK